jgi:hypothetical protein
VFAVNPDATALTLVELEAVIVEGLYEEILTPDGKEQLALTELLVETQKTGVVSAPGYGTVAFNVA